MRCLTIPVAIVTMLAALPAQGEKSGGGSAGNGSPGRAVKVDGPGPFDPKAAARKGIKPRKAAPRRGVRRNSDAERGKLPGARKGLVRFDVSCEPAALAPGADGQMTVVMSFAGDAIMLDPPPVKFEFESRQGALVVLAEPKFRPAQVGGHAPALKGLPAYDDYAIFDVPFRVDADAKTGVHPLAVTLKYGLFNGQKGGEIGNFTDVLGSKIAVNPALAAQLAGGSKRAATLPANSEVPGPSESGESDGAPAEALGGQGAAAMPVAGAGGVGEDAEPTPEPEQSNLLLIGGGGLLVAIVLLLGLRRRGQ
ncbi:MAG: hypothetical protein NXI31_09605 [bacterium]|nr:hypothetical protein [bacterium]